MNNFMTVVILTASFMVASAQGDTSTAAKKPDLAPRASKATKKELKEAKHAGAAETMLEQKTAPTAPAPKTSPIRFGVNCTTKNGVLVQSGDPAYDSCLLESHSGRAKE